MIEKMGNGDIYPEKRKSKRDKKSKRRYRVYKRGGRFRGMKLEGKEKRSEQEADKNKKGKK